VQLQARDGQFLEIDPGIGKLISLMSLQALPRRLTGDFRDVFGKGFRFDSIFSAASIDKGVMTLKDFRMSGSSAEVVISGQVDLGKETQSLRATVVPSLADTISAMAAVFGPLAIIPAAVIQKILKDPIGHAFAFDYAITGNWSDPRVERLRLTTRAPQTDEGRQ
jgi:uncharacterized protein YhdP